MKVNLCQVMENLTTRHSLLNMTHGKDYCVNESYHCIPRDSCSITDVGSHSVIITGGFSFYDGEGHVFDRVSRYNEDGFVEYLPSLLFGRYYHGCGSFIRDDGNHVS